MSTAFRNFIITFALAAILFAVVGYISVNQVLDGVFQEKTVSEDSANYSYGIAENYYGGDLSEGEGVLPTAEEFGKGYIVFFEDHKNQLTRAKLICVSNSSLKMVYNDIPLDGTIMVNGYNRTLKEIYSLNGREFLCEKLKYVFGVPFEGYMVFDTESMIKLLGETEILRDKDISISCNLPYEVKYEDPDMAEFNSNTSGEKQYIIISGNTAIDKNNAKYIFTEIPDTQYDSANASIMFDEIYESVFRSFFSNPNAKEEGVTINAFFACFETCTFSAENNIFLFNIYNGEYEVKDLSLINQMSGREFVWADIPQALEAALK